MRIVCMYCKCERKDAPLLCSKVYWHHLMEHGHHYWVETRRKANHNWTTGPETPEKMRKVIKKEKRL